MGNGTANQRISRVHIQRWCFLTNAAMLAADPELLAAHILTRWTLQCTPMEPAPGEYPYTNLLAGVVTLVGVVGHHDMYPTIGTLVVVAAGTPVLPFASLLASPLLPHALRVVKALGARPIRLQCKVLFWFCNKRKSYKFQYYL